MLNSVLGSEDRSACSHAHVRKLASFYLLSLIFLQDLFQKKSKVLFYCFFEELILLSVIIEGVPLDCLCFFKLHEGRIGRKESDLKEILKNVINRAAVQTLAIQALPILKCGCEGGWRKNGDVRELCRRKK